MKRKLLLTLVLLPALAFPQGKVWTLEDCIEYAIQHNPKRVQQEAQNKIYRQNQLEEIGGFLPSLNAESSISMNFGRGVDPETNTYISTNTFGNSYSAYSSMPLFNGLANIYRAKMANVYRLKGEEDLRQIRDEITFEVMEVYFTALYYKRTVELAQQQLDESMQNLKKTQRMEELGLKSVPDLDEIRAKEAEDRLLLTRQINKYNLEIIQLKAKMHLPSDEELRVSNYDSSVLISLETEDAFVIYKQAQNSLPQVLSANQLLKVSEMEHKIAKGQLFPSLGLGAGFSTWFFRLIDDSPYMSFHEQLKARQEQYVGVRLSIPVFNRFSRLSNVKRTKQQLVIARSQHEELLRVVYTDIVQAVADVNGLADEYTSAQKKTVAMESAHQSNLRKYEEGLIDAINLSTSANRLLNARVEESHTYLSYHLKYKLLQYYKRESSWILF
jgi:outer membrane protein TolC